MKMKIISILSILIMLLAFTAESIYAIGNNSGGNPGVGPGAGGSGHLYIPIFVGTAEKKEEAKKEVKWILKTVLDSIKFEGLDSVRLSKEDFAEGVPAGLIASAKIIFQTFEGFVCEFDSAKNAEIEDGIIEAANKIGQPYSRYWRKDNVIIMLDKDFPEEKRNMIFNVLINLKNLEVK
jgi:hypothetical protein